MTAPVLDFAEVTYAYPDGQVALRDVSLAVAAGERVAVLGPNGAGKSTLCLHCNGILRPRRGTVRVGGVPTTQRDAAEVRRRVGLVFQDPDDQLFMPTVQADVGFGPANLGYDEHAVAERVVNALAAVGMSGFGERAPHHLSFGQRKRVACATVLSMDPDVLVLDEPSANLDPRARREFAELLDGLPQALVVVTHDLPFAWQLCGRAVILDGGRLVADGPTRDLLAEDELLAAHDLELPAGFNLAIESAAAPFG